MYVEAAPQVLPGTDRVLVLDHAAGDVGVQPVIAAGKVGSRIVKVIRHGPDGSAMCREIAIPEGAQCFADTLLRRVEGLEHQ